MHLRIQPNHQFQSSRICPVSPWLDNGFCNSVLVFWSCYSTVTMVLVRQQIIFEIDQKSQYNIRLAFLPSLENPDSRISSLFMVSKYRVDIIVVLPNLLSSHVQIGYEIQNYLRHPNQEENRSYRYQQDQLTK